MLRYHNNVSPQATLDVAVDSVDTTLDIGDTTGYPPVPFVVAVERGTVNEEVCLVTAKDATTFTVTRGYDGTSGVAHAPGALVEHTSAAIDYREGYIPRIDEAERDALAGDELWDGRAIFNTDAEHLEVALPGGGWDQILPVGAVIPYAGATAPSGFLLANGQAVSRVDYAALFDVVGTTYGPGDGSNTFNVPNLTQRFPLGKAPSGTGAALGETGGSVNHVHTTSGHTHAGPSHTHSNPSTSSDGSHAHSQGSTGSAGSHAHSQGNTGSSGGLHSHSMLGLYAQFTVSGNTYHINRITTDSWVPNYQGDLNQATISQVQSTATQIGGSLGSANTTHSHTTPNTNSGGSHTHSTPNTNSNGTHSHSQANTGSAGSGQTGSGGGESTGQNNPPYLTLNYLVRA